MIYDVGAKKLRSTMARIPVMLWEDGGVLTRVDATSGESCVFELILPDVRADQKVGDAVVCFEVFVTDGEPTVPMSLYWASNSDEMVGRAGQRVRDFVAAVGLASRHAEDWDWECLFREELPAAMRYLPIFSGVKWQWVRPEFGELEFYRVLGQTRPMFLPWPELAAFVDFGQSS